MYYPTDTIEPVIQGMREGVRGHMIGLLLVLLPNIQEIWLKKYSAGANAFAKTVHNIVQSYSMNNVSNPKALAKLSEVIIHSPVPLEWSDWSDWSDDVMSLEILADLTSLPSVTSIDGKSLDIDSFFGSSESFVSAVSSVQLKDCIADKIGLDRLLSKMPNLLHFDFSFSASARVDYDYWEPEGISGIMQSLVRYSHQSLETLDICGNFATGYPIFDEGSQYLKQFQNLKQARLDVDLFVEDFRAGCACGGCYDSDDLKLLQIFNQDIPRLVDIFPASLEVVAFRGTVSLAGFEALLGGFASRAAKNVPNLKKIMFAHGIMGDPENTRMRAKFWEGDRYVLYF